MAKLKSLPKAPEGAFEPDMLRFLGADGVEIRFARFPHPAVLAMHEHAYDHTTFIFGAAHVWCEGEHLGLFINDGVTIGAGKQHMIETVYPDTWILCVHNVSRAGVIELLTERAELCRSDGLPR